MTATQRFFIALLPSPAIQAEANAIKQVFADRYHSRAALKSPPHITLQPPFEWPLDDRERLDQVLADFAAQFAPVPVTLSGFGAFAPHVVYINVVKTPALLDLQAALSQRLEVSLNIVHPNAKSRPFAPHLTVGFRDLTKQHFKAAWTEFQSRPFEHPFLAAQLTLLQHDGQRWQICCEFPFLGGSNTPA